MAMTTTPAAAEQSMEYYFLFVTASSKNNELPFQLYTTILLGWITIVVLASVLPRLKLDILGVRATLKELLSSPRNQSLDFLDIFRVIAICCVICNHLGGEGRVDVLDRHPSAEDFKRFVHGHPIFGALIGNSALGVEIFLTLSGLLAVRSWKTKSPPDRTFLANASSFIFKRWLRLAPIVAGYLFLATSPLLRELLPRFNSSMISSCSTKTLTQHLMLASNWQDMPTCLGYLWYLGLDMQLYLFVPLLLWLLTNHQKTTLYAIFLLITGSMALRALYCRAYGFCHKMDVDIPFIAFPNNNPESMRRIYDGIWHMYAHPLTNLGPFLLGLLAGHFIVYSENPTTERKKFSLTRTQSKLLFAGGLLMSIATVYGIMPEYWNPDQGDNLYNTAYTAMFRTTFSASIVIMIFGIYFTPERSPVAEYWSVLARLTFSVYLVHMPVVYLFNFSTAFQTIRTAWGIVLALPVAILGSFLAAFIFHCLFERPISRIVNYTYFHFIRN